MSNATEPRVYLTGHIDVPSDRLAAVAAALPVHIDLTRAEAGCLSFQVTPCPTMSGRFLVAEVFETQAAFDAHQTRTKASDWFRVTKGIARSYSVRVGDELTD